VWSEIALKHGVFNRFRLVVYMEGLNDEIRSNRETLREGPILNDARNLFKALFNIARKTLEEHEKGEETGAALARKLAGSPTSLSRRPIVDLARAVLVGKARSRYIALPPATTEAEREGLINELEERAKTPDEFVSGISFNYDATTDEGIAVYDAVTAKLRVNGLHPFIGAFYDEFVNKNTGLPLEMFAMAEVLLESHLHQAGLRQDQIDNIMITRDQLLRYLAKESGRRTAFSVAIALQNARNDEEKLEIEVVEAFRVLGFDANRIGGKGQPDGIARAFTSPDENKQQRRYNVTLEAKSKKNSNKKVSTKTVGISTMARHRDDANCEHAIVVAPAFDHTPGKQSALAKEIENERSKKRKDGTSGTITAIHIDDLARLVRLRPLKRIGLLRLRELFLNCSLPEECKEWIDKIENEKKSKPPYKKVINAIHTLQKRGHFEPVTYAELRNELFHATPPISYDNIDDLKELCKGMGQLAPDSIMADDQKVELDQSPTNVLKEIELATSDHFADT